MKLVINVINKIYNLYTVDKNKKNTEINYIYMMELEYCTVFVL